MSRKVKFWVEVSEKDANELDRIRKEELVQTSRMGLASIVLALFAGKNFNELKNLHGGRKVKK